jgi:hypothetical protein
MKRVLFLTAIVVVAAAGAALAAKPGKPAKGATYSGNITRVVTTGGNTFKSTFPISFKVSKNGKKVSGFKLISGYPVYCQGGGFGTAQSTSAKISAKGTFKVKLALYFAPEHSHQGFVIVSGKFGKHKEESGTIKTDFTKFGSSCNGTSKYTTKG